MSLNAQVLSLAIATVFGSTLMAQTAAPATPAAPAAAATPDNSFAYNIGLFSHYQYRGLTQTMYKPAVQGGFDYTHSGGFYAGVWGSNSSWGKDYGFGAKKGAEIDLYAGYKFTFGDVTLDLGFLHYEFTAKNYAKSSYCNCVPDKTNTDELYAAVSYKWLTLKNSITLGNAFGTHASKGSTYTDLTAAYPINEQLTLTAHAGYQYIAGKYGSGSSAFDNNKAYSYADYKLELAYDAGSGVSLGAGVTGTNAKKAYYASVYTGEFTGETTPYAFVKYTF
ncbi:MAG: hypothetical protein RLZZ502_1060 [Pseudomonadota bacterium]